MSRIQIGRIVCTALILFSGVFSSTAEAQNESGIVLGGGTDSAADGGIKAIRTDSLNFEGEVVEGLNKNPLDSIQSVGDQMFRNGERLFQKKENYRREMKRMLGDMEYTP